MFLYQIATAACPQYYTRWDERLSGEVRFTEDLNEKGKDIYGFQMPEFYYNLKIVKLVNFLFINVVEFFFKARPNLIIFQIEI